MKEEEKEAIEQLKSWREYIIKNKEKVNKANDIEFYLRTALNLIQKQQEEIEKLKDIKEIAESKVTDLRKIKQVDKLKSENWILQQELEKKGKIINLMAEDLEAPCYFNNKIKCSKGKSCKECTIQYYERKVEDDVKNKR